MPDGDCWESLEAIGWPELRVHPMHLAADEAIAVAEFWIECRMAGQQPEEGGRLHQTAKLMAAFAVMDRVKRVLGQRRESVRNLW